MPEQVQENNKQILLHACCAICSAYPIQYLRELGYEPVAYFFNPNIFPANEYAKRLDTQKILCDKLNCDLIIEDYEPQEYFDAMLGLEEYLEGSIRCKKCFELRLLQTIKKAQELNINKYTTSISISPHKNFNYIQEIAQNFSKNYEVEFLDINFRKKDGFLKTNQLSKALNLYRQHYCGCEMSMSLRKN
jgi:predicted adenine nucleotide alpha hydrolase (AANH) superfamily ATPase